MIVFYTTQIRHLASSIALKQGNYLIKKFSDGELYIKVEEDVRGKIVWIVAATCPPADSLLELFFLIDALQREHAIINLFITYFGYARQDRAEPGEALSSEVICNFLKTFKLNKIFIIHPHNESLHTLLNFTTIVPLDLLCTIARPYDAVAAPDKGAYDLVTAMSTQCAKSSISLTKIRPEHEQVTILDAQDEINHKKVLIVDNLISTGKTVINASKLLTTYGAQSIDACAIHGVFSPGSYAALEASPLQTIYVTDTLPQESTHARIQVLSIAPCIEATIRKQS